MLCPSWFEDEEIDVDMDISTELQQQVVFQVQEARAGVLHHMDPTAANVCYTSIAAHQECTCACYCTRILCLIGFVWSTDFPIQYCVISGLFTQSDCQSPSHIVNSLNLLKTYVFQFVSVGLF